MIDPGQFRDYVIRPTLADIDLGGLAAERLLLGTALTESGLIYLHQLGAGPALGLYQCEPATFHDIWANFLAGRTPLEGHVRELSVAPEDPMQLVTNLSLATAICRVHYFRAPAPLPDQRDAAGMAAYHKKWYNTVGGATDPTVSVANFQRAIAI